MCRKSNGRTYTIKQTTHRQVQENDTVPIYKIIDTGCLASHTCTLYMHVGTGFVSATD